MAEMTFSIHNPKSQIGNQQDRRFPTQIKEIVDFEEELATSKN